MTCAIQFQFFFSTSNSISLCACQIGFILKLMKTIETKQNKTKWTAIWKPLFTHISTQRFQFQWSKVRMYLRVLFLLSLSFSLSYNKFSQKRLGFVQIFWHFCCCFFRFYFSREMYAWPIDMIMYQRWNGEKKKDKTMNCEKFVFSCP